MESFIDVSKVLLRVMFFFNFQSYIYLKNNSNHLKGAFYTACCNIWLSIFKIFVCIIIGVVHQYDVYQFNFGGNLSMEQFSF